MIILAELLTVKTDMDGVIYGFILKLSDSGALYIAIGIVGAAVSAACEQHWKI
ncbi:MAG: hypothetical protein LBV03_03300 [Fusobacteriales bacterium]|nr:hypothetical protein [Fusobacteriales bacterium]